MADTLTFMSSAAFVSRHVFSYLNKFKIFFKYVMPPSLAFLISFLENENKETHFVLVLNFIFVFQKNGRKYLYFYDKTLMKKIKSETFFLFLSIYLFCVYVCTFCAYSFPFWCCVRCFSIQTEIFFSCFNNNK